jgi:hypothetical protein
MDDECPECSNMAVCCGYHDGAIMDEMRWQAFADAWLAIGMAAFIATRDCRCSDYLEPKTLGERVGRVVRRQG